MQGDITMIRQDAAKKQIKQPGRLVSILVYTAATMGFILCCWVTLKKFTAPFTEMLPWYDPSGDSFRSFYICLFPSMILISLVKRMCGSFGIGSQALRNLPFFTAMALSLAAGGAVESRTLQAAGAVICMVAGFSALFLCADDLLEYWGRKTLGEPWEGHGLPPLREDFPMEKNGRGVEDGRA